MSTVQAPTLRPYQLEALDAIASANAQGSNRVLIQAATGTGKTVTFAAMLRYPKLRQWLEQQPGQGARMLVIAHREELLDQAAAKIQAENRGLVVSIEQGERRASKYSNVVVASIQTLAAMKFRRLHNLLRHHSFNLVIVDEAHHAAAASYRNALVHLGFLPPADATDSDEIEAADFDDVAVMEEALRGWDARAPKDRLLVGVTATPNRSDAIGLGCVFQTLAFTYPMKAAIDDGYLVPLEPWVIETDTSLENVRTSHGDFNQKDLAEAVNTQRRNDLALASWQEIAGGLPTIAFTVDVAHAHDLARTFEGAGIRARAISGETPKDDRRAYLRAYQEGRIDVVTNCMVLTEGTDLPLTQCILQAKPTKSATLLEQMIGRGLRLYEGKDRCRVIDLVDVARKHSLQTSPVLYGLPPGLIVKGQDLDDVKAALDEFREKYPQLDVDGALSSGRLTLAQLQARASTFDIWKVPDLGPYQEHVTLNWLRSGDDTFRLSYPWGNGTEQLTVQRDLLGKFELVVTVRTVVGEKGPRPDVQVRQSTMAKGLEDAVSALRLAEGFVGQHRSSISRLRDREASWRVRPASRKQLDLLRKWRVPFAATVTAGQASDLIDLAKARRSR